MGGPETEKNSDEENPNLKEPATGITTPIKKVLSFTSLSSATNAPHYGTVKSNEPQERHQDRYSQLDEGVEIQSASRPRKNTDDSDVTVSGSNPTGKNWWDKGTVTKFQLRNVKDTPPLLRYPFIYDGYRVNFTFPLALKSIFKLHNETFNIWTHLLAALLFMGLAGYTFSYVYATATAATSSDFDPLYVHVLLFALYFVCVTGSWSCSAIFHTCSCMSKSMCYTVGSGDYVGIFLNILGCSFPAMFYGFDCYRPFQILYCTFIMSSCLVCCGLVVSPKWHVAEGPWVMLRQVIYMVLVMSCFIPAVHYCVVIKSWNPIVIDVVLRIFGMLGLEFLAFGFYVSHIPERWFPGRISVYGTSHQIFHIILVIAALEHYWTLMVMFKFDADHPCRERDWLRT